MLRKTIIDVFSFFLAALPALAVYNVLPGTSLGMLMILLCVPFVLLCRTGKGLAKDELKLLVAILLLTFISSAYHSVYHAWWYDTTLLFHNIYSILICFIPLVFVAKSASIKTFIRSAYIIAVFASVIVIWQRLSYISTGSFYNDIFIPGLEVKRDIETMSVKRPSAFFSEPAHLCIFLLPLFYNSLLKRNHLLTGLFLFAILCSGSTTGFLLSGIVFMYDVYFKGGKHRFGRLFLSIISFIIVYLLIIKLYPQILLENVDKLSSAQSGEGSSALRLLGPANYLLLFDNFEWVFGITLNQLENFVESFGIMDYGRNANYANAALYMVISYGVIGLFFLILYMIRKWRSCKLTKGFFLVFLGIICSDQILFNAHFLYLVVFVLMSDELAQDTGYGIRPE